MDGTARIWPAEGGAPVVLEGHEGEVKAAIFSPDGVHVVTAGVDGTVRRWNLDGSSTLTLACSQLAAVWSVAYSPNGKYLVAGGEDGIVRVCSADGGGEAVQLSGHEGRVYSVAFTANGERVASAAADGTLRVWPADGSCQAMVLRGHSRDVVTLGFSADGDWVLSGSVDGTVRRWPVVPETLRDSLWGASRSCFGDPEAYTRLLGYEPQQARDAWDQQCLGAVWAGAGAVCRFW